MEWLNQARTTLRDRRIRLTHPFPLEEEEMRAIEKIITSSDLDEAYFEGLTPEEEAILKKQFKNELRKSLTHTVKAIRLNLVKHGGGEIDLTQEPHLQGIADEYRDAIDLVLCLSPVLKPSTFENAATIAPVWNSDKLQELLRAENIACCLRDRGLEIKAWEVDQMLSDSEKLHLITRNILDPIAGFGKVITHLKGTLSTTRIVQCFEEEGGKITEEEALQAFPPAQENVWLYTTPKTL